jgi:hypothetical protein
LNIIPKLDGGTEGISNDVKAFDGGAGEKQIGFNPAFYGLLFNSIRSSVSGNRIDSISSGTVPPKITGTVPVGGTAPYSYAWDKSYDENFTNPVSLTGNSIDFIPTDAETTAVWFRRKVTDSSLPLTWIDQSWPVKFSMRIITSSEKIVTRKPLSVYPNPAKDEVVIELRHSQTGRTDITVSTISGNIVRSNSSYKSDEIFRHTFAISDLLPGLYNLTITINGKTIGSARFVKSKR